MTAGAVANARENPAISNAKTRCGGLPGKSASLSVRFAIRLLRDRHPIQTRHNPDAKRPARWTSNRDAEGPARALKNRSNHAVGDVLAKLRTGGSRAQRPTPYCPLAVKLSVRLN